MMLPKLSGYQVLEQIKLQDPPPRVIMVTANDGRSHEKYAEAIGADAYMRKPLSLDQVLETAVMLLKHVPGR